LHFHLDSVIHLYWKTCFCCIHLLLSLCILERSREFGCSWNFYSLVKVSWTEEQEIEW
jgi:hypothetical protein